MGGTLYLNKPKYCQYNLVKGDEAWFHYSNKTGITYNNTNNNMETCKAQESVKQPLTTLQTGEQRNMKSQCNVKNKDKTITIPYYTKIHKSH